MALFTPAERRFVEAASCLVYCNPFLPRRIEAEREALGADFVETGPVWNVFSDPETNRPNLMALRDRVEALAPVARERLAGGASAGEKELVLYEDLILYLLYYRTQEALRHGVVAGADGKRKQNFAGVYRAHADAAEQFLQIPEVRLPTAYDATHLFACFFQMRRAFLLIFDQIVGRSIPMARLRASVWQSIFTHDMRRYQRVMHSRMGDFTTLIVGESGTGKELVAAAVALSRYVPFDARRGAFAEDYANLFHPLNLSALSPTLIESELFGHRRGAFTGALEDRAGWLETCRPLGSVFLDEIGELDPQIQVKLLRVLQARTFQRLGDTQGRHFAGKIIAATHRDLAAEMRGGGFRQDFYYRLCSDIVTTPPLREQLAERPEDLHNMVAFLVRRIAGEEASGLSDEVEEWIEGNLGRAYGWPGNFRELEQCVRNVIIRGEYRPSAAAPRSEAEALAGALGEGRLTAEEVVRRYCAAVYRQTGSYEETARRLGLDRRTVKAKVTANESEEA